MSAVLLPDFQKIMGVLDDVAHLPVISTLVWLVNMLSSLFWPLRYAFVPAPKTAEVEQQRLFPLIEEVSMSHAPSAETSGAEAHLCSTGLTTRLLPFKNAKGEIEWAFTDDFQPGSELDAFKVTMDRSASKEGSILSPVTSNSSNNDSILSGKKPESYQINTPLSTTSADDKMKDSEEDGEEDPNQVYQCPHCDSSFKMRGYLTRHLKKHSTEKAYQCPFHESSIYKDENDVTHKCHPSGGFSRRDTYKTHLKSRHFKYPKGTHIKDRNLSPGNCSMCGDWFQNAEMWSEIHIEGAECKYLPHGFKGKSRIKNRMKKEMARMVKEQRQQMRRGGNCRRRAEYQSPNSATPNSINTPLTGAASIYDYNNSPTLSVSSSVGQQHIPQQPLLDNMHRSTPQAMVTPTLVPTTGLPIKAEDDYDDEFCLDTEQMCLPQDKLLDQRIFQQLPALVFSFGAYPQAANAMHYT